MRCRPHDRGPAILPRVLLSALPGELERRVGRTAIGAVSVVTEEKRHINTARVYVVDGVPDRAPYGIRLGFARDRAGERPCEANAGMCVLEAAWREIVACAGHRIRQSGKASAGPARVTVNREVGRVGFVKGMVGDDLRFASAIDDVLVPGRS